MTAGFKRGHSRDRAATYIGVWLALLGLLACTVASSFLDLRGFNGAVNFLIACAKAALVIWFFMHLRRSGALVRVVAAAGAFWIAILIGLSFADFLTRGR